MATQDIVTDIIETITTIIMVGTVAADTTVAAHTDDTLTYTIHADIPAIIGNPGGNT